MNAKNAKNAKQIDDLEDLTPAQCAAVERLFAQELPGGVPACLSPHTAAVLVEAGIAEEMERTLPGQPPVRVRGHQLTMRGHAMYCHWADRSLPDDGF